MALIFANVTDVRIPQGDCIRIQETVGGRILWEKKKGKYEIRKNGVTVDWVDIDQLQRKITDGTAQSQYGIGAQLILHLEYDDGTYRNVEYPMVFGTFRQFTNQANRSVNCLGLNALYHLPFSSVYDHGNPPTCRWRDSKLRTWMNSDSETSGGFEASSVSADAPGMKRMFPADFIEAIIPVKISSSWRYNTNNAADVTTDTFFILSLTELSTDVGNSMVSDREPAPWEYWEQKMGGYIPITQTHDGRKVRRVPISGQVSGEVYPYWCRTPNYYSGGDAYGYWVNSQIIGGKMLGVEWGGVLPACALPGI